MDFFLSFLMNQQFNSHSCEKFSYLVASLLTVWLIEDIFWVCRSQQCGPLISPGPDYVAQISSLKLLPAKKLREILTFGGIKISAFALGGKHHRTHHSRTPHSQIPFLQGHSHPTVTQNADLDLHIPLEKFSDLTTWCSIMTEPLRMDITQALIWAHSTTSP